MRSLLPYARRTASSRILRQSTPPSTRISSSTTSWTSAATPCCLRSTPSPTAAARARTTPPWLAATTPWALVTATRATAAASFGTLPPTCPSAWTPRQWMSATRQPTPSTASTCCTLVLPLSRLPSPPCLSGAAHRPPCTALSSCPPVTAPRTSTLPCSRLNGRASRWSCPWVLRTSGRTRTPRCSGSTMCSTLSPATTSLALSRTLLWRTARLFSLLCLTSPPRILATSRPPPRLSRLATTWTRAWA
mmetsp:Transcript_32470/g.82492  ORF Transcript_32470/g.82492 Transcript_32470/m.82492 type:complete len:248 (-) Transcript_32470:549-1292(-)